MDYALCYICLVFFNQIIKLNLKMQILRHQKSQYFNLFVKSKNVYWRFLYYLGSLWYDCNPPLHFRFLTAKLLPCSEKLNHVWTPVVLTYWQKTHLKTPLIYLQHVMLMNIQRRGSRAVARRKCAAAAAL